MFEPGQIERLRPGFRYLLRDAPTGLDFIADFVERVRCRVAAGHVLDRFEPERGDLVDWLITPELVRKRAIDFVRSLDRRMHLGGDDLAGLPAAHRSDILGEARFDPDRLQVRTSRPPSQPEVFGLIQLWPRLDRDHPEFGVWQAAVALAVGSDWEQRIRSVHASAATAHERRRVELLDAAARASSPRHAERWRQRADACFVESVLWPLPAEEISELLGVSRSNAYQIARRFRHRALRCMLAAMPGLEDWQSDVGAEEQDAGEEDDV